uniref:RRM domain-containing protein n=1 Tax=Arundo donax TaxID=35708 RepID=A0A0A9CRG1_ARUDO
MFSSVGRVAGVEFVRTNGRSFAYVEFHCPSDKALSKLFSTYNGCKWKGGKLRLEKAKEHYLARLKREWEQDAAAAAAAAAQEAAAVKDSVEKQEKPKLDKAALEGMKINIYFPKLRKVKALPFKGTGKHKYSFRHIAVPSYPIHFCDCEEHCGPPEAANNEYASVLNAAAYEKEHNIMNSVMNKLFEKENEHLDPSEMEKCDHIDTLEPSDDVNDMQVQETEEAPEDDLDDLQAEETEESSEEDIDDDLVINIAPHKSNKSVGKASMEKPELNKDLQLRKRPRFEEASLPQKRQRSEASSEPRNRKQAVISGRRNTGKSLPAIPEASQNGQKSLGLTGKGTYGFSSELPGDKNSADPQGVKAQTISSTKNETAQNMVAAEPKRGSFWTQKSSWRDLVGGMGSTSFGISQVWQNTNPAPPVSPNVSESGKSSKSLEATTQLSCEQNLPSSTGMPSTGATDSSTGHDTVECKENNKTQKARVVPKITISEVCPFMRNAESGKQWSKAKKVLTGFIKKGKESSGSNTGKGKPSKRNHDDGQLRLPEAFARPSELP